MSDADDISCAACEGASLPLDGAELPALQQMLDPGWQLIPGPRLRQEYRVPDFRQALELANVIGEIAERRRHHPALHVSWGMLRVTTWTHNARGLTRADFDLARDIDAAYASKTMRSEP